MSDILVQAMVTLPHPQQQLQVQIPPWSACIPTHHLPSRLAGWPRVPPGEHDGGRKQAPPDAADPGLQPTAAAARHFVCGEVLQLQPTPSTGSCKLQAIRPHAACGSSLHHPLAAARPAATPNTTSSRSACRCCLPPPLRRSPSCCCQQPATASRPLWLLVAPPPLLRLLRSHTR